MSKDEELARLFHDTYERLAPEYGYETREDTKQFNPTSKNGKLMIAVARVIQHEHNICTCPLCLYHRGPDEFMKEIE